MFRPITAQAALNHDIQSTAVRCAAKLLGNCPTDRRRRGARDVSARVEGLRCAWRSNDLIGRQHRPREEGRLRHEKGGDSAPDSLRGRRSYRPPLDDSAILRGTGSRPPACPFSASSTVLPAASLMSTRAPFSSRKLATSVHPQLIAPKIAV